MKSFKYEFNTIDTCNMCGAKGDDFSLFGQRLNKSQGLNPSKKIGITTRIVQCTKCRLIFSNPLPIPIDIQSHYGLPPEDYWHPSYFKIDENYFTSEINWLKKIKNIHPGMKSLDIGAGIGKQMIALKKHGFNAFGIEASEPFYKRAIEVMGVDKNNIQLCTLEKAEFENATFDFISFGAVLEHLYDPSRSLQKALQWLKPDGLIHVEVPSADWLINKLINFIYKIKGSSYVGNISPMHSPYHLYEFSLNSFKMNSLTNNYEIKDYGYYVCDTTFPKIFNPILKPYMKKTNTGMQLCVWLSKK